MLPTNNMGTCNRIAKKWSQILQIGYYAFYSNLLIQTQNQDSVYMPSQHRKGEPFDL